VNKLKINKIQISQMFNSVIDVYIWVVILQPVLTIIGFLLVEDKINGVIIFVVDVDEVDLVF
jgi:hypothetical protein